MILKLLIKYHRRKLNKLIDKNVSYKYILKESKILDKYIVQLYKI